MRSGGEPLSCAVNLINNHISVLYDIIYHQIIDGSACSRKRGSIRSVSSGTVAGENGPRVFQHRHETERFLADLKERLETFGLALHPDKTRLIEFGRFAARDRQLRGEGKPETAMTDLNALEALYCAALETPPGRTAPVPWGLEHGDAGTGHDDGHHNGKHGHDVRVAPGDAARGARGSSHHPPHTGTIAANRFGCAAARLQTPSAPIETPVR